MKRVIFYLFYDADGIVDDYIPYKLRALRPHAEHIFVVSNSSLTPQSRAKLEAVADTVWARENIGFDVWAYRDAMRAFGMDRLAEYDELILMNYTFFGPIHDFAETFERMDRRPVDFWGLTAHGEMPNNPLNNGQGTLREHLQSHWLAVRKTMFTSLEFATYWDTMPAINSYTDSILNHEERFTSYFAGKGFRWETAFPLTDYPARHPIFDNAALMLERRCPIVKRRIFFHEPNYLERHAILGRRVLELVSRSGYPTELIWQNVVRSAEPRTLYTNFTLLSVLPDAPLPTPVSPRRVAVIAHVFYADMAEEMAARIAMIPGSVDVFVTTDQQEKVAAIEAALKPHDLPRIEIRVVASNRGRETSAFLVGCRDVLTSDRYDLICKIHSKRSAQDSFNHGNLFKHHLFDNLLSSPGYVSHLLALFDDPSLGMVFPPIVNIGYPTMGHSWFTNREAAQELAEELGIATRFDRDTPVAPYGGMFWARPQALRKLLAREWEWTDFPDESGWSDGGLAHVIERLYAYSAMSCGFYVRSAMNADWAEINYAFLEYKLQRLAALLPHYLDEQVQTLHRDRTMRSALRVLKNSLDASHPALSRALAPGYSLARRRMAREARRPPVDR